MPRFNLLLPQISGLEKVYSINTSFDENPAKSTKLLFVGYLRLFDNTHYFSMKPQPDFVDIKPIYSNKVHAMPYS